MIAAHDFQGYVFAGAQYGYECFCGNDYGRYGPSEKCDMQCSGDHRNSPDGICGGYFANTVMTTGLGKIIEVQMYNTNGYRSITL